MTMGFASSYRDANMMTSGRSDKRMFNDLSSKVVNMNGEVAIKVNPFNSN